MNRRHFMLLTGNLAISYSIPAYAQRAERLPVVGVLWHAANAEEEASFFEPLRQGFTALGYVEGKNIIFEDRYPAEQLDRFDSLAAELVRLKVDALVAGSIPAALAVQRATATIPIVFVANPDPVGLKLVASLARPGGNITGLSAVSFDLAAKRVQILKEAIPSLSRVALLANPNTPYDAPRLIAEIQPIADQLQISLETIEARAPGELSEAFSKMAGHFGAVIVSQNSMYFTERRRIAQLALAVQLPTMVPADLFTVEGGLMSYGPSWPAIFRHAATYVDKILHGAKAADLPVEQPTKFDLVINLKTAKALGLDLPLELIGRADKIIE